MNILFVSPEVVPFAKTGGLADVIGALPEAIAKRDHISNLILPFYRTVKTNGFRPILFKANIPVELGTKKDQFNLYFLRHNSCNVYFVEKDDLYDRDFLYGTPKGDYPDNALRFGFFAKAVIESIHYIGKQDIIHCNDWQSALIPLYLKVFYKDQDNFKATKVLFTIHNMAYQGLFEKGVLETLGLSEEFFTPEKLEFYGKVNFMKAGIIYSDAISTVSEGYAREILTPEFGCGLDGLLRTRKNVVYGIVNGVDYSVWNPAVDTFIKANYDEKDLSNKKICKKDLVEQFGIQYDPDRPLIGMITRLAEQKGIDLVNDAMPQMVKMGMDFVLLGFGDEKYNDIFRKLAKKYSGHVAARIDFDNALAHKIEAGCDMFLMPSRYEPCGLNQLYSLKYATVPIVRAVGGLDDTIENFNPLTKKGNGFKFKEATSEALLRTLKEACNIFKNKPLWEILLHNCVSCDYSWASSAEKYERLYNRL